MNKRKAGSSHSVGDNGRQRLLKQQTETTQVNESPSQRGWLNC